MNIHKQRKLALVKREEERKLEQKCIEEQRQENIKQIKPEIKQKIIENYKNGELNAYIFCNYYLNEKMVDEETIKKLIEEILNYYEIKANIKFLHNKSIGNKYYEIKFID